MNTDAENKIVTTEIRIWRFAIIVYLSGFLAGYLAFG